MSVEPGKIKYIPLEHVEHDDNLHDQIRLLVLLPGAEGDPIQCRLMQIWRNSNPVYEALSYIWGTTESSRTILVDGMPVMIRQNLWTALKSLRDKENPLSLWIDALCINQEDLFERCHQVSKMSSIYRGAMKVLVWLGKAENNSNILFDLLQKIERDFNGDRNLLENWRQELVMKCFTGKKIHLAIDSALHSICVRPYWKRVWIVQEILSVREVELLCGSKRLSWSNFVTALGEIILNPLSYRLDSIYATPAKAIADQKEDGNVAGKYEFKKLIDLCLSCGSQCEDVRDRIYGILSISEDVNDGCGPELIPDYSISPLGLYINVCPVYCWVDSRGRYTFSKLPYTERLEFFDTAPQLLGDPLWDDSLQEFPSISDSKNLHEFRSIAHIHGILTIFTRATITQTGAIVIHEKHSSRQCDQLESFVAKLKKEDLVSQPDSLGYGWSFTHLTKRDFHRTEKIGGHYSPNEYMVYSPQGIVFSGSQPSTGKCRPFVADDEMAGIASSDIQPGDLLCAIEAVPKLYIIVRRDNDSLALSLMCRAITCWRASDNPGLPWGCHSNMEDGKLGIYDNYILFSKMLIVLSFVKIST